MQCFAAARLAHSTLSRAAFLRLACPLIRWVAVRRPRKQLQGSRVPGVFKLQEVDERGSWMSSLLLVLFCPVVDRGSERNDELGDMIVARELGVTTPVRPGEVPANPHRSGASESGSDA